MYPKDLDVSDATPPAGFGRPDLTAFARLDGLGLSLDPPVFDNSRGL